MSFLSFLIEYKTIIIFYLIIVLLVYFNRKKFTFQGKIIAMYKTKIGIKLMNTIAQKYPRLVITLGYIGIFFGFLGMLLIVFFVLQGLYTLFFRPDLPATVSLVLPGVKIPGSQFFVPFWFGIIALFFVIVVHEFAHGVLARVYKMKVKSSGLVLFGPIFGAFVEPDEKVLKKKKDSIKQSIFAAGPFANMLLAVFVVLLVSFLVVPVEGTLVNKVGFSFDEIPEGFPGYEAGLKANVVYNEVDDQEVLDATSFVIAIQGKKPGDTLVIGNQDMKHDIVLTEHPEKEGAPYIGVLGIQSEVTQKKPGFMPIYNVVLWFHKLFEWIFILSIGIGLANLLPLGPIDGGRMIQNVFHRIFGEKQGNLVWARISVFFFISLVLLIIVPIFRAVV